MTNWSYIAHIKRRIILNKWPTFLINIYFYQNFLSVAIFSLNTVYLQLPHIREAFWVYKGSVKCERIHKLHQNRENYGNSYVVSLTQFLTRQNWRDCPLRPLIGRVVSLEWQTQPSKPDHFPHGDKIKRTQISAWKTRMWTTEL